MESYDLLVIGAGPAGCMAAGQAARRGLSVLLVERNRRPARKILVTGKGRCNVTNNCEPQELIRQVKTNGRFLYTAFHRFTAQDAMAFFESLGIPLKTERGNRVFPVSDRAMDIADGLIRYIQHSNICLAAGWRARELLLEGDRVAGLVCEGEQGERQIFRAASYLVATGGKSYPLTGSTGDGYRLAHQAGHTIEPVKPSLIPIELKDSFCGELMGLSLKNVQLTVWELPEERKADGSDREMEKGRSGDKKTRKGRGTVFSEQGEMLFTHFGVSGPLVLSASSYMGREVERYAMEVNFKPALTPEQLDARLLRDFEKYANRNFDNALQDLLPRLLIPVVVRLSEIGGETKVHQITRLQRRKLAELLQHFSLHPKRFRPIEEAVITSGGVCVKEIDPKTMASKLCPNLYFAGEVMDVDGFTGGYNLQIAYSTGFLAGTSVPGRR